MHFLQVFNEIDSISGNKATNRGTGIDRDHYFVVGPQHKVCGLQEEWVFVYIGTNFCTISWVYITLPAYKHCLNFLHMRLNNSPYQCILCTEVIVDVAQWHLRLLRDISEKRDQCPSILPLPLGRSSRPNSFFAFYEPLDKSHHRQKRCKRVNICYH